MLKRSRFFWFIMLTVPEKTAPAAVQDVYFSLSVQPEVPSAHGLCFLNHYLANQSIVIVLYLCGLAQAWSCCMYENMAAVKQ